MKIRLEDEEPKRDHLKAPKRGRGWSLPLPVRPNSREPRQVSLSLANVAAA